MGRAYTTTGISVNFGGTATPTVGNLQTNRYIAFGTDVINPTIFFDWNGTSQFQIDATPVEQTFWLSLNTGTIYLEASGGLIHCKIGTASTLKVTDQASGTLMVLNGNTGNLQLKGTVQQNTVF